MQQRHPVHRALLSVSGKAGIVEFAQALSARGMGLLSTGGTACLLAEKGLPVTKVFDYTGFLEMMDGRVKILHPKVHGSIPGRHGQGDGIMEQRGIVPIDMVAVNLYPFTETVAYEGCSLENTVENIDIGDPTMVRSVAKNHRDVVIVVKSSDYDAIIKEMDVNEGPLTLETRLDLTTKTFEHTVAYDSTITSYLGSIASAYHGENKGAAGRFPRTLNLNFTKKQDMHYGEDNHQQAAFYIEEDVREASIATAQQVQGKALSYNNTADTDATLKCMKESSEPACVIVKHANPCGMAASTSVLDAHDRVYKTDPTSAFGGIITLNRRLGAKATQAIISRQFMGVIIVPSTTEDAPKTTAAKRNVCVLICGQWAQRAPGLDLRYVNGGLLVRGKDLGMMSEGELRVVSKRQPTEQELRDALFYWRVIKFIKSNAIVYAKENMTIGMGVGQMNRVCSTEIAGIKVTDEGLEVKDSAMASDAFFPFRDGIDAAAAVGMSYVIQPGGSTRDNEVIAAADEHGITMVPTDMRHFRH